jgi:hypothetical protein
MYPPDRRRSPERPRRTQQIRTPKNSFRRGWTDLSWTIFSAESCKGDGPSETAPRIIVARRSASGNFRYSRRIGRSFPCGNAAKKIHVAAHTTFSIGVQLDMQQRALRVRRDEFFFLVLAAPRLFP